jgi:hypothetical protein
VDRECRIQPGPRHRDDRNWISTTANQPEAWESGGSAGTFSPNAAFAQTAVPVTAGTAYTARLQWKASDPIPAPSSWEPDPFPPGLPTYSPTSLSVVLIPSPAGAVVRNSTAQFSSANSNGTTWQAINNTSLN